MCARIFLDQATRFWGMHKGTEHMILRDGGLRSTFNCWDFYSRAYIFDLLYDLFLGNNEDRIILHHILLLIVEFWIFYSVVHEQILSKFKQRFVERKRGPLDADIVLWFRYYL